MSLLKFNGRGERSGRRRGKLGVEVLERRQMLAGSALNLPASSSGISFTDVLFNQFGDATVSASISSGAEKDGYLVFGKPTEGPKIIRADRVGNSLDLEMGRYVRGTLTESDDDTNGLNPQFTYDTVVDQQQLVDNGAALVGGDAFQGQTFTPARRGELVRVDIGFAKNGENSADVTLEIQSTSGGAPSGTVLDSVTIAGDDIPVGVDQTLTFDFSSSPAYLESGTLYAMVLKAPDNTMGTYGLRFANGDVYAAGSARQSTDGGTGWGSRNADNVFRTYVHETEHFIAIGERQQNDTGDYTLTVDHPNQEAQQTILFNEGAAIPVTGGINSFRDYKFFDFVAPRTGTYEIVVQPLSGFDPPTFAFDATMLLFDSQGRPVVGDFVSPLNNAGIGGAEVASPSLTRGERYWLRVDGQGNFRGLFIVNMDMPGRSSLPFSPGGFVDVFTNQFGDAVLGADLDPADNKDTYRLAFGNAGDVTVRADRGSNGLDLEMGQWDELGQSVQRIDDDTNGLNPSLTIPVDSLEDYFFSVGELDEDTTGDYSLSVEGPAPEVFDLFIGAGVNPPSFSEFTHPDEAQFYRFTPSVNGDHQFNLSPPDGETVTGVLFDDAGDVVAGSHTEPLIVPPSDALTLSNLVAGQTYVLRLDLAGDATGFVGIQIDAPNGFDFGDLPASYGTLLVNDGARHELGLGGFFRLGDSIDLDLDGQPTEIGFPTADDNDGVEPLSTLVLNPASSTQTAFRITSTAPGRIDAWIDLDLDGTFSESDRILDSVEVVEGENILTVTLPPSTLAASESLVSLPARFRLSSSGGLGPTGSASDGEVEDYFFSGEVVGEHDIFIQTPADALTLNPIGSDVRATTGPTIIYQGPVSSASDLIVFGTAGDDVLEVNVPVTSLGRLFAFLGGSGRDTLRWGISGQTLDFADEEVAAINLSVLDVRGPGVNLVRLSDRTIRTMPPESTTLQVMLDPTDRIEIADATFTIDSVRVEDGQFIVRAASDEAAMDIVGMGWTNPVAPLDVSTTGGISALDALLIINELNNRSFTVPNLMDLIPPADLPASNPFPMQFYDTSGDGRVSALDALLVINFLNQNDAPPPTPEPIVGPTIPSRVDGAGQNATTATSPRLFSRVPDPVIQRDALQTIRKWPAVAAPHADAIASVADWAPVVDVDLATESPDGAESLGNGVETLSSGAPPVR